MRYGGTEIVESLAGDRPRDHLLDVADLRGAGYCQRSNGLAGEQIHEASDARRTNSEQAVKGFVCGRAKIDRNHRRPVDAWGKPKGSTVVSGLGLLGSYLQSLCNLGLVALRARRNQRWWMVGAVQA